MVQKKKYVFLKLFLEAVKMIPFSAPACMLLIKSDPIREIKIVFVIGNFCFSRNEKEQIAHPEKKKIPFKYIDIAGVVCI